MTKPKVTKTEKTPLLTTHKATTPAPGVTRGVMLVTPALAAEWLKSNTRNRRLDATVVERLATVIREGGWRITHQGIAFGTDGTLYDGQHRLSAIVEAGVSVHVEVTRGLDAVTLDVIDIGGAGTRSAGHVLQITDGVHVSTNVIAILSAAFDLTEYGHLIPRTKQTPQRLRAALAAHGAAINAISPLLNVGAHNKINPASAAAAIAVVWATDPVKAEAFSQMLRSGEGLSAMHPALTLRNYLLARSVKVGAVTDREAINLRTFAALDAFVRGDSLKVLKANEGARERFIAAWKRARG